MVTAMIAICHHQAYPVGGTLIVRYPPAHPTRAWERDMPPVPNLLGPAAIALLGVLTAVALAGRSLARRRTITTGAYAAAAPNQWAAPWTEPSASAQPSTWPPASSQAGVSTDDAAVLETTS
jgi:hypothetical protein